MKIITTEKELARHMFEMFKIKHNTWHESKGLPGYYFWNHENKETGTSYPIIYAELELLKKVANKYDFNNGFNYMRVMRVMKEIPLGDEGICWKDIDEKGWKAFIRPEMQTPPKNDEYLGINKQAETHLWELLDIYAIFKGGIDKFKKTKAKKEREEVERVIGEQVKAKKLLKRNFFNEESIRENKILSESEPK